MAMKRILLLFFILMVPFAYSATLHGTIYNLDLRPAEKAIVKIDSVPQQTFLAMDGTYSLKLNPGEYTMTVTYTEDGENYVAEEEVKIVEEGTFVTDIIMLPDFSEEEELLEEEIKIDPAVIDDYQYMQAFLIIAFVAFLLVSGYVFVTKKKSRKTELDKEICDMVLEFIKKNGGRVTQKEVRKNFHYSEAKISLVISELVHKGKIEKIKKSKGNIIILK